MSHPSYGEPDCCTPFRRLTPSGSVQSWHAFSCRVSPNVFIEPPSRAEVASHAARQPSQADLDYEDYHRDDDDDLRGGGFLG